MLEIGTESRYDQYELALVRPKPLVERPLRFTVRDEPGVLAQLTTLLGAHGISIRKMVQDQSEPGMPVPVRIRLEGDAAELGGLRPGLSVVVHVDGRRKAADEARP